MKNIKNILMNKRFRLLLLIAVFSFFSTQVVEAKTVSNSTTVDTTRLEYFNNMFNRKEYNNYLLVAEYNNNGSYNYTTYYYFCLTNDGLDTSNLTNITSQCDEMYRYYSSNNQYHLEKVEDDELIIKDSIYYTNDLNKDLYNIRINTWIIAFASILIFIFIILCVLFHLF